MTAGWGSSASKLEEMTVLPNPWTSPEQYLAAEEAAETKSEYFDGSVLAMSGASFRHNTLVSNTIQVLGTALRSGPCRVFPSDLKVTVPSRKRYFYPDASVICGRPLAAEKRKDVATNPTVLIEVLSESTAAYDRGPKFFSYQTIPSLQEYVLLWQDEQRAEVYRRSGESSWLYTLLDGNEATLRLDSVRVELALSDLYLGWAELES